MQLNKYFLSVTRFTATVALAAMLPVSSYATDVLLRASADTTISEHSNLGSGTVPLGTWDQLYVIGTPGFKSSALFQFDLSAQTGRTAVGSVGWFTLSIYNFTDPFVTMDLREITAPWNESLTTLNNGGEPFGALVNNAVASQTNPNHRPGYRDFNFAVPVSLIQQWIDTPATNFGLALVPTGGRDIYFASREYTPPGGSLGDWSPTLAFSLAPIPEPSVYILFLIGLLPLRSVLRRNRKMNRDCNLISYRN